MLAASCLDVPQPVQEKPASIQSSPSNFKFLFSNRHFASNRTPTQVSQDKMFEIDDSRHFPLICFGPSDLP
jgi:hypothetical protein